jgi:hypothetical protein
MLFSWLQSLPYIESSSNGIYPHDIVREVLDLAAWADDSDNTHSIQQRVQAYVAKSCDSPGNRPKGNELDHMHAIQTRP